MDRILRGIMKYRHTDRKTMVAQFEKVRDHPEPKAVFFTCMDSRMIPTRFTETNVGDMFVVRNAGNLIPHSQHFLDEITTTEPAALELGCIVNDIRHIIVCGHSDCKKRCVARAGDEPAPRAAGRAVLVAGEPAHLAAAGVAVRARQLVARQVLAARGGGLPRPAHLPGGDPHEAVRGLHRPRGQVRRLRQAVADTEAVPGHRRGPEGACFPPSEPQCVRRPGTHPRAP
ncbi:uncharacterized protein LOC134537538 isoform X4 [Bacillus rossius redtenbacheri]|uniref:uncharacterized protein LOC134537538 isoform X4 n=1 Tax=Bacillus rossius redtenbacheri TaxID=93214 RepID=UPI002FDCE115